MALFRLNEGSNKQTRKEIRPDENSRHDGRLGSKPQKCVPPRGHAQFEGSTKPVLTPENPRLPPPGRLARGSLVGSVGLGSCCLGRQQLQSFNSCRRTRQDAKISQVAYRSGVIPMPLWEPSFLHASCEAIPLLAPIRKHPRIEADQANPRNSARCSEPLLPCRRQLPLHDIARPSAVQSPS